MLTCRQVEVGQDYGQQESQPFEQASEVVAGGGEDGVSGVAVGSDEIVPAHAVLGFGVSDDRLDRGSAPEFAFDGLGDAESLAGDIDPELVAGRGVVAAIAAVGDDAGKARADLRLDLRDHGGECVAIVRVARQRLGVGDELASGRAMQRGGDRHLDAEFVRPMRLALADAFDLGRVQ